MLQNSQQKVVTHLGKMLGLIQSKQFKQNDPVKISSQIKLSQKLNHHQQQNNKKAQNQLKRKQLNFNLEGSINSHVKNFQFQSQKLEWCGISFSARAINLIQNHVRSLAIKQKPLQLRFWGVIRGTVRDYYIIQGRKQPYKSFDQISADAQKNGEGVNYYTYWISTNLQRQDWTILPDILPSHIRASRQIKKLFTGNLQEGIQTYPQFKGRQKHYLKAQLCRITHNLQINPKGIYKVNDQNPKITEYEQEVKIPEFAELNSLEGWVHKNQFILNLGRCTHYVDQTLPEEQILAKTSELAQKDPQGQRLKGINQDKVPEQLGLGLENPWLLKVVGNSQIFTKDDVNLIYGVIVLKNIYWPGWTTIGYKNGFSNIYIGNGLKQTQTTLNIYQNPDLQKQPQDIPEYPEPNPKELPKQEPPAQPKPDEQ